MRERGYREETWECFGRKAEVESSQDPDLITVLTHVLLQRCPGLGDVDSTQLIFKLSEGAHWIDRS